MIGFLDPVRLWLLLAVAAVAVAYARGRRRPAAYPVHLSTARFVLEAQRRTRRSWRRHLPLAAVLGLLTLLVLGFARPAVAVSVPVRSGDVVVALDTSASMGAADVSPSRLVAAREAAAAFVRGLPEQVRVGVVTFAGGAQLAVAPTTDRDRALAAIGSATGPGQGTALGEAVGVAVTALAGSPAEGGRRVVVLSDGESTVGRPVADAAAAARAARVPVDTIAVGTAGGSVVIDGETLPVPVSGTSLQELAAGTGGEARDAAGAAELDGAYDDVATAVTVRSERREVTGWVGLAAAVLAVLVGVLGLRRATPLPSR